MGDERLAIMLRELPLCRAAAVVRGVPYDDLPDLEQDAREAAWKALRKHPELHEREQARAWFWSVGVRLAARYHRTKRKHPAEPRDPAELAELVPVPSAEALVLARVDLARLDAAMADLAMERPEVHALIEAHHLDEEAVVDASARLGVNVNTAWDRLRRGRIALRAALRRGAA